MNTTAYLDGQLELDLVQGLPPGSHQVALPFTNWNEGLCCAVDATGNYFFAGSTCRVGPVALPFNLPQTAFRPWVVKLLSDGKTPDVTFNGGLPLLLDPGLGTTVGQSAEATDIYVDPASGLITIAFIVSNDGAGSGFDGLWRVQANGVPLASFGGAGWITYNRVARATFSACRVVVQKVGANAGKPILWQAGASGTNFAGQMSRYNLDGSHDTTFNPNFGFQLSNLTAGHDALPRAIVLDAADQIYAGYNTPGDGVQIAGWLIERYSANGLPAGAGWGAAGANACGVRQTFTQVVGSDLAELIIDAAGKLVVVGQSGYNVAGNGQIQLARYLTTTGALDTTFNATGLAAFDYHAIYQPSSGPSRALLVTGGDVVLAGVTAGAIAGGGFSDGGKVLLARYTMANPSVDVWHTLAPQLGTSSEVDYGLGGQGWPAGPASNLCAIGHDMNDTAPTGRYAQAVASYYTLAGALDVSKGT